MAHLVNGQYVVDVLLIPKQVGGRDRWTTSHEHEVAQYKEAHPSLHFIGTIHTHPWHHPHTPVPSSVDLHQHQKIQVDQPSAIAIIVEPENQQKTFYTITDFGMHELENCQADQSDNNGFHPHRSIRRLYTFALHAQTENVEFEVIDQR